MDNPRRVANLDVLDSNGKSMLILNNHSGNVISIY